MYVNLSYLKQQERLMHGKILPDSPKTSRFSTLEILILTVSFSFLLKAIILLAEVLNFFSIWNVNSLLFVSPQNFNNLWKPSICSTETAILDITFLLLSLEGKKIHLHLGFLSPCLNILEENETCNTNGLSIFVSAYHQVIYLNSYCLFLASNRTKRITKWKYVQKTWSTDILYIFTY